jgi:hypothetical protein
VGAWRHHVDLRHYTVSVVRGHGVADNALSYILGRHDSAAAPYYPQMSDHDLSLRFVDTVSQPAQPPSVRVSGGPLG